jgi:DNA-binding transcriptional ArsR family regulator
MSSIFPIREKISLDREPEPRLVDLDEETADEVFEALASSTTREIFLELHNQPQTASDLADVTDTSVQNVQYHLEKLTDVDLVDVVDTWYSERGSEMNVYAPTDESLVLFAGRDKQSAFRRLLNRFAGVFALLVPPSILAGYLANWRESSTQEDVGAEIAGGGEDSGETAFATRSEGDEPEVGIESVDENGGGDDAAAADATPEPESTPTPTEDAAGTPAGADGDGGDDAVATPDSVDAEADGGEVGSETVDLTSGDTQSVEVDINGSTEVAEALASENETVYLVAESTSNDIFGIDPNVALAFFLGGLVVYGAFVLRQRAF